MSHLSSGKVVSLFIFLLVLDLTVLPVLIANPFRPILIYLFVLYGLFETNTRFSILLALAAGLLRDLIVSGPFALETMLLVTFTFAFDRALSKFDRTSLFTRAGVSWFFIFLVTFLNMLVTQIFFAGSGIHQAPVFAISIQAATASAIAMPLFSYLAARWFRARIAFKQYELFR